jgi:hypothetical protein
MAATASALELAPRQDEEVLAVETQARTIADEAHDLQIVDEQANATALEMLSTVRSTVKRIEALKKRWLEPLNKQVKLIRADFDAIAAPAKEADAILSRKTSAYRAKVAEAARKEQARLNALAAKRQERAAARAEERGEDPPGAQGRDAGKDGRHRQRRQGHLPQADALRDRRCGSRAARVVYSRHQETGSCSSCRHHRSRQRPVWGARLGH